MGVNRRDFLKIAGVSLAGLGAGPAINLLPGQGTETLARQAEAPLAVGRHWAMVIDLNKLTEDDVKACVKACHQEHNVPDIRNLDGSVNTKEEIKWLWPEKFHNAFPDKASEFTSEQFEKKQFLVLCNHCDDPPCVRVCPTKATFKREEDGIVMMDMHRCIGCRFCMAACPYGSRSFNWGDPRPYIEKANPEYPTRVKGVVEKCNFCAERLAKGQHPACVEACTSGAIVFGDLDNPESGVRKLLKENYTIRRKTGLGTGPNIYYIV